MWSRSIEIREIIIDQLASVYGRLGQHEMRSIELSLGNLPPMHAIQSRICVHIGNTSYATAHLAGCKLPSDSSIDRISCWPSLPYTDAS